MVQPVLSESVHLTLNSQVARLSQEIVNLKREGPWQRRKQCGCDGFNAWGVLAFWFQARSTNDSMSLLTMIMNPDRAKDLSDIMNKLDRSGRHLTVRYVSRSSG